MSVTSKIYIMLLYDYFKNSITTFYLTHFIIVKVHFIEINKIFNNVIRFHFQSFVYTFSHTLKYLNTKT